jgi:DHA3 family macrolide efflux protein-like MFS transporter
MFTGFLPLGMIVFGPMADVIPMRWMMIGTGILLVILATSIPYQKSFYSQGIFKPASIQ